MLKLFQCLLYLAIIGALGFFIGRLLPKAWIDPNLLLYRGFACENCGKIYLKIGIRYWKDKLPDMSRIFKGAIPLKRLGHFCGMDKIRLLIEETCIAEFVHILLAFEGLACIWIWPGIGGVLVSVAYILGQIPFILIQRYNRPRFIQILNKMKQAAHSQNRPLPNMEGEICY